ncbi:hypothetical protein U1Q18_051916, partial [Sarracenia purpurea var. burkii]
MAKPQSDTTGRIDYFATVEITIPDGAKKVFFTLEAYYSRSEENTTLKVPLTKESLAGPVRKCIELFSSIFNPEYREIDCAEIPK